MFAHNGDLKGFRPQLHAAFRLVGDNDSELTSCWVMQGLAKTHASVPSIRELTATLRKLAPQATACGTFNFMLSNGQALWAHCSTTLYSPGRQAPFGRAHLQDEDLSVDFADSTTPTDRVAVVVTEPLTRDEAWHAFAPAELRVFVGGSALELD